MIETTEVMRLFAPHRGDAIVVPGRGTRHWMPLSSSIELDAPVGDPAMGGHAGFAFGLALARPERKVVLFDSEGDILMSLGMLATIAEQKPANFYHFLLDNECYATTGGQPVPGAKLVDYAAMARAAGYPKAHSFTEAADLAGGIGGILDGPGPVFVAMKVYPEVQNEPIGKRRPAQPRSRTQVVEDLRRALGPAG